MPKTATKKAFHYINLIMTKGAEKKIKQIAYQKLLSTKKLKIIQKEAVDFQKTAKHEEEENMGNELKLNLPMEYTVNKSLRIKKIVQISTEMKELQ